MLRLVILIILAAPTIWGFVRYIKTPLPIRHDIQVAYMKDYALSELNRIKARADVDDLNYWTRLAQEGNLRAKLETGRILFMQGNQNPENYTKAIPYLGPAADAGLPLAQNAIGVAAQNGLGLQKDYIEAYKWFKLASDQGLDLAEQNLMNLSRSLTSVEITEALRRQKLWLDAYKTRLIDVKT